MALGVCKSAPEPPASAVSAHGLSCSAALWLFLERGWCPCPLRWLQTLSPWPQGSPMGRLSSFCISAPSVTENLQALCVSCHPWVYQFFGSWIERRHFNKHCCYSNLLCAVHFFQDGLKAKHAHRTGGHSAPHSPASVQVYPDNS